MNNNSCIDKFREEIRELDSGYFDGHTCFNDLSPEQKLDWLAELVVFVHESRSFRVQKNSGLK